MPQLSDFEEVEDFIDFHRQPSTTGDKILEFFQKHDRLTPRQIHVLLRKQISRVTIHRQLKRLVIKKLIYKEGKTPHVFYWMEKMNEPT